MKITDEHRETAERIHHEAWSNIGPTSKESFPSYVKAQERHILLTAKALAQRDQVMIEKIASMIEEHGYCDPCCDASRYCPKETDIDYKDLPKAIRELAKEDNNKT